MQQTLYATNARSGENSSFTRDQEEIGTRGVDRTSIGSAVGRGFGSSVAAAATAVLVLLGSGLAFAQSAPAPTVPDPAIELRRQQDRERAIREKQERRVDIRSEAPAPVAPTRIPADETPCFDIRKVELRGDDARRFQWVLDHLAGAQGDDSPIGKCLGAQGIGAVLKRAQDALITKGYVTTRVLAEPQDLKTGVLALTAIPGRINAIRFAPGTTGRARAWNAVPAQPGDILNLRDIEQGLENFMRVPTASADIKIEPAAGPDAKPGYSDLVIDYKQRIVPLRLSLFADDSGTKATGKYQGGVTLSLDNGLTLNDLFYVAMTHDLGGGEEGPRGTRGMTAHYSIPFGYWTVGTTLTRYRYFQTIAGATQNFTYSGTSDNADVRLARLVYRDARRKTLLGIRAFQRKSKNYIDDTEVEVQRRVVGGWEASVGHREFAGSATIDANLAYQRGTGAFGSLPAPEERFGEGTSRFGLVRADVSVNLPFRLAAQQLRYLGAVRLQRNLTPLTPQDRFAIGGRYTVRGFDGEQSLVAERGWLVRNDFGLVVGQTGQELYVGIDHGEVSGPSSDQLVGKRLTGAVVGLRGGFRNLQYDAFVGRPVQKPEFFRTADATAGISVSLNF